MRDGAHGEVEAGISGANSGLPLQDKCAHSIVMSVGSDKPEDDWYAQTGTGNQITYGKYKNYDGGHRIVYSGTAGKERLQPTANTSMMQKSFHAHRHIRVLRSYKLASKYAPAAGIRYDGLYEIVRMDNIHAETSMWLFVLHRLPGQENIRWQGDDVRPHPRELVKFEKIQELLQGEQ